MLAQRARERQAMKKEQVEDQKRHEGRAVKAEFEFQLEQKKVLRERERELSQKNLLRQSSQKDMHEQVLRDQRDRQAEEARKWRVLDQEEKHVRSEMERRRISDSKFLQEENDKFARGSVLLFDRPSPRNAKE